MKNYQEKYKLTTKFAYSCSMISICLSIEYFSYIYCSSCVPELSFFINSSYIYFLTYVASYLIFLTNTFNMFFLVSFCKLYLPFFNIFVQLSKNISSFCFIIRQFIDISFDSTWSYFIPANVHILALIYLRVMLDYVIYVVEGYSLFWFYLIYYYSSNFKFS